MKCSADMAVQNVIGDSCRGATWVALHNGGGVGWCVCVRTCMCVCALYIHVCDLYNVGEK